MKMKGDQVGRWKMKGASELREKGSEGRRGKGRLLALEERRQSDSRGEVSETQTKRAQVLARGDKFSRSFSGKRGMKRLQVLGEERDASVEGDRGEVRQTSRGGDERTRDVVSTLGESKRAKDVGDS